MYLCICNVFLYIMFLINNNTTRCVWTEHTHLIDRSTMMIMQHEYEIEIDNIEERGRKDRQRSRHMIIGSAIIQYIIQNSTDH